MQTPDCRKAANLGTERDGLGTESFEVVVADGGYAIANRPDSSVRPTTRATCRVMEEHTHGNYYHAGHHPRSSLRS